MKYLCLGPSSLGGFSILGFLKAIEHHLSDLEEISGSSSGSMIALFILITKSVTKTFDIFLDVKIKELTEYNIENLLNDYGFISHVKIKEYLSKHCDLTFKELYEKTKIKFYVSAYCVERQTNVYFSVDSHPDLKVVESICMSISVPFLMSSYKFDGYHYIDGGTFESIPMMPFLNKKPSEIICIKILPVHEVSEIIEITNIKDFISNVFTTLVNKTQITFNHNAIIYEIPLVKEDGNIFDFHGTTYEQKVKLFMKGYHRALTHSGLAK